MSLSKERDNNKRKTESLIPPSPNPQLGHLLFVDGFKWTHVFLFLPAP